VPGDEFNNALWENPGFGHRWLTLKLIGVQSNRAAIGARIRVTVVEDGVRRSVYRHVTSGGSFGANPLRQTIGLGGAERIESVEVYWPTSDMLQRFPGLELDAAYEVVEGEAQARPLDLPRFRFAPGEPSATPHHEHAGSP